MTMTTSVSVALRNALLEGSSVKEQLDGGFIYVYAGPVPADADAALDMTNDHTQLVKIAADATPVDSGVTGLTYGTAVNGALPKTSAETWAGVVNFVGKDAAQAGVGPLTATFFRACAAADNGQAAGSTTTPRIQGSINTAGADLNVSSTSLSDDGTATFGIASAEVRQPAA
jgi:hypothetical protein